MGTLLDLSSLVVVPSGYKEDVVYSVKPTDGSGDLDFTRSNDTATRVNSAGLIEKVRTNLATYSSDFSTAGLTIDATISTDTTTDPFGTSLADSLLEAAATGPHLWYRDFTVSNGTEITFSIYVKSIGGRNVRIIESTGTGSELAVVDLSNGSILASAGQVGVTSAGSGWYRISVTVISTATTVRFITYALDGTSISYAGDITKGLFLFGHQLEYGVMTDYIPTTTAAVSVGMTANVPRLDYSGGGCPKLLLEPQRTNLVTFSEQFDNAAWTKTAVNVTANNAVSPDGYNNADKITETATTGIHRVFQNASVSAGNNTFSFFAKKDERSSIEIVFGGTAYPSNYAVLVNLDTQVVTGNTADITTSIVDFGNGWLRCSFTSSASSSASSDIQIYLRKDGVSRSYAGDGTSGLYLWGCQLEAGSYVSSYIPTLGAAVTRGADAAFKTGISSLIGQTEGTLFLDFVPQSKDAVDDFRMQVYDGTNWLFVGNVNGNIRGYINAGSIVQYDDIDESVVIGKRYKLALSYSSTGAAFYVNGVKVNELVSSITIPATSVFSLGNSNSSADNLLISQVSGLILFPTRLTDTQAIELTTL